MGETLCRESLRAARGGDRRAYNEVARWLTQELIAYYDYQGRSRDETHELCQTAAVRIIEKFERAPEDPEVFRAWVRAFAENVGKEHISRRQRHNRKQAAARCQPPRTPPRRPDSVLAFQRLLAWVRGELSKIPTPYRDTLRLMLEHESHGEVADALDIPEGTVRRRVWWIRRLLERERS